jgi:hypothetical protein
MDRRNVVLHEKFHLVIAQLRAREEDHTIPIPSRPAHDICMSRLEQPELFAPLVHAMAQVRYGRTTLLAFVLHCTIL